MKDKQQMNTSLHKWINSERFGTFPKVSRANINELIALEKFLVLAIVEENKLNEITNEEAEFRDMIESVIRFELNSNLSILIIQIFV